MACRTTAIVVGRCVDTFRLTTDVLGVASTLVWSVDRYSDWFLKSLKSENFSDFKKSSPFSKTRASARSALAMSAGSIYFDGMMTLPSLVGSNTP